MLMNAVTVIFSPAEILILNEWVRSEIFLARPKLEGSLTTPKRARSGNFAIVSLLEGASNNSRQA